MDELKTVAWIPEFNPPLPTNLECLTGQALLDNIETLDALTDSNGLASLTRFTDMREVPEDFEGTAEELDAVLGPWTEWFDAEWGFEAAQAILDLIRSNPESREQLTAPDAVEAELADLVRVLRVAHAADAEFRLSVTWNDEISSPQ